jgi:hypothetical protein
MFEETMKKPNTVHVDTGLQGNRRLIQQGCLAYADT